MRHPNKYLIFLTALVFFFASCYNSEKGQANIFHYNESTGVASIDPAFSKNQSIMWVVHQLYNTLVEVDSQLVLHPSLARRWEISEDKKTYTFFLHDSVFFHDDACFPGGRGRKMTATDVVYSFSRIMDKQTASPGSWIFNKKIDSAEGFKALDDTTFQLKLARPYNPILGILSMQ